MTAATTPATDAEIDTLLRFLDAKMEDSFDFSHTLHSLIARIHQEREKAGWLPIETAPKDGKMLLVCLPRQQNLIIRARFNRVHGYWISDYEGEGGIKRPHFFHDGDLWQPLPTPPALSQEERT